MYKLCSIILIAGLMFSCSVSETEIETIPQDPMQLSDFDITRSVVGNKLENPYSVQNMQRALDNLLAKNKAKTLSNSTIEATHYYVKFFTTSKEDMDALEADSLELFSYPLDYEIEVAGEYYVEEGSEYSDGHWYWTAVPVGYAFPEVSYEILEDLFLIDQEENENEFNSKIAYINDLFELEDEALRITGNWEEPEDSDLEDGIKAKKKKRPQGTIRVMNTSTNKYEPVVGVKVRTNRWFKWGHGYTNEDGFYKINKKYRRNIRYSVRFTNKAGFKIWNTIIDINPAIHKRGGFLNLKKYNRSGWNKDFTTSDKAWRFATVNNAVVKYFKYCEQLGIGKPHSNLRIAARKSSAGLGSAPMLRHVWGYHGFTTNYKLANFFLKSNIINLSLNLIALVTKFAQPDITIDAGYSSRNKTADVYQTTFHELGHASHMKKVGSSYWVKVINYIITYGAYGDGTGANAGYVGVAEMWGYYIDARLVKEEFGTFNFNSRPDLISGWIPAEINKRVVDEANYTVQDIFSSLHSTVNTIPKLKNEYNVRVGKNRSTVNQIFEEYGY